jgi:predicted secreted hydrolase
VFEEPLTDSRRVSMRLVFCSLLLMCSFFISGCNGSDKHARLSLEQKFDIAKYFGANSSGGFARAHRKWEFTFPKDHGPHPRYKNERWYFNGQLVNDAGRRFGYQLTITRTGLRAETLATNSLTGLSRNEKSLQKHPSKWRGDQLYRAHFTVTDTETAQFYSYQKNSRNALELAGGQYIKSDDPKKDNHQLKIWIDDWVIESQSNTVFPLHIKAKQEKIGIDLIVNNTKPVVFNGDDGLFKKSAKSGDASYYYSIPRLESIGRISIGVNEYEVQGHSWFDREWSTASLGEDIAGWDWFAVHIDDKRELSFYQLRDKNGTMNNLSSGSIIFANGKYRALSAADIDLEVKREWLSPTTGIIYPAAWRLSVPSQSIELFISPMVEDQELKFAPRYWAGAVRVSIFETKREEPSKPKTGYGYVELVGY